MSGRDQVAHTVLATHATVAEALARQDELRSYLAVVEDAVTVARHALGPDPLTVGRDPGRHVVIQDARVSRLHLQVFVADGRVIAEDLGSSNGTFLDGRRLSGPTVVPEGRWLQVGSRLLKHERRSPREVEREDELRRDLDKARSYVQSLLPAPIDNGPVRTDWLYQPSAQLGGDAFCYGSLDDDRVFACLVDVSGHGVGAAMHSVSLLNVLRQRALPGVDFGNPSQVLRALNGRFPMDEHDGMFFTAWYGVYSVGSRRLAYACAGHHAGRLYADGAAPAALRTPGPMIGALPEARYAAAHADVPRGARLYLFSDGAFETTAPDGRDHALDEFLPLLDAGACAPLRGEAERVYREVRARARPGPLADDFSLLVADFD